MTVQLDKRGLMSLMRTENERIMDMLLTYNVPDSIEDVQYDEYLLNNDKSAAKAKHALGARKATPIDELQDRLNIIKNKMKAKKRPASERSKKKREAKKLRKNKEVKKILVSAAKSIKNEQQKLSNAGNDENADKKDIKKLIPKPVFNEEGKIVFSKFDFASHPGAKVKKSHQNPREILKKIKQTDKKINELKEKGEVEKAAEIKSEIAWKKAFDKIEGKKVKDDPKLLYKAIKKRKTEKKKSKKEWVERKQKVESGIEHRQKKRQENINKRINDKKSTKLKKLSKKGRVIPGF
ncbi:surfeit locus protein 6 homolog [Rhagoletis pomonella]|uniref:surfeit locus protein 6 homolog n=1 Tax=Rhagoletis pomonella TaxID=28610 RepID=UPI001782A1B7|nr:surfeit locus protein 6 homolog [Rhagoletis pomonella]